jgi:rRNA maturation endonuclease Nob1
MEILVDWEASTATMLRCPSCATDVPAGSRFCLACGSPVSAAVASEEATVAISPKQAPHTSSSID